MSAAVVWWCPVCEDVIEAGIELYGDVHVLNDSEHHGVVRAVRETESNGDTRTYVPKDWSSVLAAAERRGRRWAIDTLREAANHEKYDSVAERWIDHAADALEAIMATEEANRG